MKSFLQKTGYIVLALSLYISNVGAQLIAFPGAEGAGKVTTGGRGTATVASKVFAVTSLVDDGSAGTLRWALTQSATYRTVIFRISGTIHLASALKIGKPNTTVAGQTAPGEGICLADYPVIVDADNVIVRYMRFRMGDKNENKGMVNGSGNDDAFDGTGHNNIIIDHCTMSWSNDEACSFYRGDNLTLQWNLISEPLNYSYHFETGDADFEHHGYGGIWGGQHASFHHNLLAHCQGRAPRFDGSRNLGNGSTVGLENADFVNNVIYDWGGYDTNGGEGGNYNIVNNYYKYGPSTSHSTAAGVKITQEIINPFSQTTPALPYGQYYLSGNYVDAASAVTADNWKGASFAGGSLADSSTSKAISPFVIVPMQTQTSADAYNAVLNRTGCSLPNRDTLDDRIINDVINRTGRIIDVQGGYPHGTAYALTVNAWPFLLSTTAPVTTNANNIPDAWLAQRGLTGVAISGLNGYNSNGYTHLENFLNGDSIVASGVTNSCVNFNIPNYGNSGVWVDGKDTTYGYYASLAYLVSTDTNNVIASVLTDGNNDAFNGIYYTTKTTRYYTENINQRTFPYLNRNIRLMPVSGTSQTFTTRFYFTKAEFDSLKAADTSIHSLADLEIIETSDDPDALACMSQIDILGSEIMPSSYGTYGTYQTGYYLEFTGTLSEGTLFVAAKPATVVPLRLTVFTATAENHSVNTIWKTENEINTKNFIVERSADSKSFTAVGNVAAKNLSANNVYNFKDTNPLSGTSYYRLKMIDINGAYQFSQTVAVTLNSLSLVSANPNPAINTITVSYPKTTSAIQLQVISSDGKKVQQLSAVAGSSSTLINVSALARGIYAVLFSGNNYTQTLKFVKQ